MQELRIPKGCNLETFYAQHNIHPPHTLAYVCTHESLSFLYLDFPQPSDGNIAILSQLVIRNNFCSHKCSSNPCCVLEIPWLLAVVVVVAVVTGVVTG